MGSSVSLTQITSPTDLDVLSVDSTSPTGLTPAEIEECSDEGPPREPGCSRISNVLRALA